MSPARTLRLASTIGPVDAGVVPALLEAYREQSGVEVELTAVGTGQALDLARDGAVDVALVHAPALEARFMEEGYGDEHREIMANDFVLVGPTTDPAAVSGLTDIVAAFQRIAAAGTLFITRNDRSGTHVKELEVWRATELEPSAPWYRVAESGPRGNLATALEAAALQAYTLLDRATVITLGAELPLDVLVEGDPLLINVFSAIAVNPRRVVGVDGHGAHDLVAWLTGPRAQKLIEDFGVAQHGRPLFFPRVTSEFSRRSP